MLRVLVDSGSSIRQEQCDELNVELIPLKIMLNGVEYDDGVNLSLDKFYHELMVNKQWPKTSLPSLKLVEEKVDKYTKQGDDIIIVTISSKISGTNNAMHVLFDEYENVRIIDSKGAVGYMRLIVKEINKYRDKDLDYIIGKVNKLIPRLRLMAIPDTLAYLFKGGRLKIIEFIVGSLLTIKPIIGFAPDGTVVALTKKHGTKAGMRYINECLADSDPNYEIIGTYTYDDTNMKKLMDGAAPEYRERIKYLDNIDCAIAAHWGPYAYGYVYVIK